MYIQPVRTVILLVIMGVVLSCATKTDTIVWKDKEYKGGKIDSVLIIGVAKKEENKALFEDVLSTSLQREGVTPHKSVDVFKQGEKLSKEVIKEKAVNLGVKAVIITHLVSITKEDNYRPAATITSKNAQANHIGSYFNHVDTMVKYPGDYDQKRVVRLKTSMFETSSEKLIFTISSRTLDPKSVKDTIQSVCKALVKDFKKNNLL